MKKLLLLLTIFTIACGSAKIKHELVGVKYHKYKYNPVVLSGFCDGWEEGYQQALDDCLKVALTPLCPVRPINVEDTWESGYGYGYSAAKNKHCDGEQ